MQGLDVSRRVFCRRCGSRLSDGMCPSCEVRPEQSPTAPSPARRRPGIDRATVIALSSTVVALAALLVSYRGIQGLDDELAAVHSQLDQAQDDAAAATARSEELAQRIDDQDAELDSTRQEVADQPSTTKVAKQASPSVFTVYVGDYLGSAFVVESSGGGSTLLTNYHVVADAYVSGDKQVEIRRGDRRIPGTVVEVSQADDVAVIEVAKSLPALEMTPARAAIGTPVLVLGSPNGLGGTVTSGVVSAYRSIEATDFLQFSAPISPGNSGGPVINQTGQVVGVTVMKDVREDTDGIGYAIPVERVCQAVDVC